MRTSRPPTRTSVTMNDQALAPWGGDQPHNNLQPYLTLNFCIALQGRLSAAYLIDARAAVAP